MLETLSDAKLPGQENPSLDAAGISIMTEDVPPNTSWKRG
jgi:hypothetical protein